MGFFAALGAIVTTADGVAWALVALALALFFLTFLVDGCTGREGHVHPVATGGFLASALVSLAALWALLISFLLAQGFQLAHIIAALIYAAVFLVIARYVIKAGSLAGRSIRQRSQR